VLRALGLSGDLADNVIRFSFGQFLSEDDIMRGIKLLRDVVERVNAR
jgi:cysteine sulfinate desulfinase/cysteine desulfurase-like protein